MKSHPLALAAWLWVILMPIVGSFWLAVNYSEVLNFNLLTPIDVLMFCILASLLMGFALLPTTLTSLFAGFWIGWLGFPMILIAYSLANIIGYFLGKYFNIDFRDFIFSRYPRFEHAVEARKKNLGSLIFFIRISPIIPFAISNFLFAALRIPLSKVLLYGIPGMLPRTLMAFLAGIVAGDFMEAKENLREPWQLILLLILFLTSLWGIWKNWNRQKV